MAVMELSKLGEISKRQQNSWERHTPNQSEQAGGLQGAGGVLLGGGLLASGVPGQQVPHNAKVVPGAMKGGIFGFRESMHRKALNKFEEADTPAARRSRPQYHTDQFITERNAGKIASEKKIIQHMARGRKIGYGATGLGAAALGAGAYLKRRSEDKDMGRRVRKDNWRERYEDRRSSKYIGAGGALAAGGYGLGAALDRQGKKWGGEAKIAINEAHNAVPALPKNGPVSSSDAWNYRGDFDTTKPSKVRTAGRLHGHASQAKYFSDTYKMNAKAAKLAGLAGLGVAGYGVLARTRDNDRRALMRRAGM
jgi:hypothetical protein